MNDLVIREYQENDWTRLCEIHDEGRLNELEGSVDLGAFLTLEQTAENEGLFDDQLWVALLEDIVVGFIAFEPEEITWLYVDPNRYRKGIGKALIQFAMERCSDKIVIEVLHKNEPAIRLYESLGFKKIKRVEGKLEGNEPYPAIGFILEYHKE